MDVFIDSINQLTEKKVTMLFEIGRDLTPCAFAFCESAHKRFRSRIIIEAVTHQSFKSDDNVFQYQILWSICVHIGSFVVAEMHCSR